MTIALSDSGSLPWAFNRLKVSRQEMPASTRIRVDELSTMAALPRLPLANTDRDTPMRAAYLLTLWKRDNFLDSRYFGAGKQDHQPNKSECSRRISGSLRNASRWLPKITRMGIGEFPAEITSASEARIPGRSPKPT